MDPYGYGNPTRTIAQIHVYMAEGRELRAIALIYHIYNDGRGTDVCYKDPFHHEVAVTEEMRVRYFLQQQLMEGNTVIHICNGAASASA